jgi:sugar phosphate permease
MWYIAAAYFCFFYGSYFYMTWFPTYLLEYRHLSLRAVCLLASVPLITAMIGDIVGGPKGARNAAAHRAPDLILATHRGARNRMPRRHR